MSTLTGASSVVPSVGRTKKDIRLFLWTVTVVWLVTLAALAAGEIDKIRSNAPLLIVWILVLAVVNLLPLRGWQSIHLTADLPITVAAALVLSPAETGLVATLGAFDPRELGAKTTIGKAMCDRSQVGIASCLGSFAVHLLDKSPSSSAWIVLLAFTALAVDSILNYSLVATAVSLEHGDPFGRVLRKMRLGALTDFLLTFFAWGVLGAMLASLYNQIHAWALLAFLGPTLLGRQVLMRSQMYIDKDQAYRSRGKVLMELSRHIDQERTDERRLIAADLHDEALQALFKVNLMSHVLKSDLAGGRLLDLELDVKELVAAADSATETLRNLIGDLRQSSLGSGGITPTLSKLIDRLAEQTSIKMHASIGPVEADSPKQLAIYQIAKEALTNALTHSRANNIWVELRQHPDALTLQVQDDGVGFDTDLQKEGHYGIEIMKERATAADGHLFMDSTPNEGCNIMVVLGRKGQSQPRNDMWS